MPKISTFPKKKLCRQTSPLAIYLHLKYLNPTQILLLFSNAIPLHQLCHFRFKPQLILTLNLSMCICQIDQIHRLNKYPYLIQHVAKVAKTARCEYIRSKWPRRIFCTLTKLINRKLRHDKSQDSHPRCCCKLPTMEWLPFRGLDGWFPTLCVFFGNGVYASSHQ